jgi:hypothetical protein
MDAAATCSMDGYKLPRMRGGALSGVLLLLWSYKILFEQHYVHAECDGLLLVGKTGAEVIDSKRSGRVRKILTVFVDENNC